MQRERENGRFRRNVFYSVDVDFVVVLRPRPLRFFSFCFCFLFKGRHESHQKYQQLTNRTGHTLPQLSIVKPLCPPPHPSAPHRPPLTFPVFSRSVCLRPRSLEGAYTSCFHWSAEVKSADKQDGVHHNRTPAGGEQNHLQEGGGTAETVEN